MRTKIKATVLLAFLSISVGFYVRPASATVVKKLSIESVPPGAEVYSKRGIREEFIGKTPLLYNATFHSEISVLRMLFKKRGYKDVTLKVSAKQDKVSVRLESLPIAAESNVHKDPQLSKIQKQLNPVINRIVPKLLEQQIQMDFNLADPIKVSKAGKESWLVVPVVVGNLQEKIKGTGEARRAMLLKVLWRNLGGTIIIPLAKEIRHYDRITGILLEVRLDEKRYIFKGMPKFGTKTELECVGGFMTVIMPYPTRSGTIAVPVFNPCLHKRPVTKFAPVVTHKVGVVKDEAIAQYFAPIDLLNTKISPEELYKKLGIILTDSKGNQLIRQGIGGN